MNHKAAECVGMYGFGNGKEGREFCSSCDKSRLCWENTTEAIKIQTDSRKFTRYTKLVDTYSKRYPNQKKKIYRLVIAALAKRGEVDPYMERVVKNTRKGFEEANADLPSIVREFRGGIWIYNGNVLANIR